MTFEYKNVYVGNTSTVVGPYEYQGPLGNLFDKTFKDFYCDSKTIEQGEINLEKTAINILLKKTKLKEKDINLLISGDLLNQITPSVYSAKCFKVPFLGIYTACASSVEGIIIGSNFIDEGYIEKSIVTVSSHNLTSEKQFRNPTEYGALKPKTATFTSTGAGSILLQNKKTNIAVKSATIGKIIDFNQKDPNNMGAVMACAAADTIREHLKDLKIDPDYYDLILTGDLGIYGKEILKEYMLKKYKIALNNYDDCGVLLYDLDHQKEVNAGASGPASSALVTYSYIYKLMQEKKLKKVLLVATGALFSPISIYQKMSIPSIANAISLEVV